MYVTLYASNEWATRPDGDKINAQPPHQAQLLCVLSLIHI